jgi:L-rhamnose isomerase/sugar isomerase
MRRDVDALVGHALDRFSIELPSWGFANTGTRFGKYLQAAAAVTVEEKLADAGEVHRVTGACPTVALHTQWDLPDGLAGIDALARAAARAGVRPGAMNPNLFQDQEYKFGSLANPRVDVRRKAIDHCIASAAIGRGLRSRDVSLWLADGSNYPGTADIRQRKRWLYEGLAEVAAALAADQRLLIEYKPFEPAFYHTDIADWGMALLFARAAGSNAKVLVDTGHHYQGQNIEQIVAWLLDEQMLGGFHFNDRRYADDDLTLGSIDPYQVFRIFHEIQFFEFQTGGPADIAYVVDQSHNLKGKIEAMIQTVTMAQALYAKAALVDYDPLIAAQRATELVAAESCLQDAFATDVRGAVVTWRLAHGLPADPLDAFKQSGYLERITDERAQRPQAAAPSGYA